MDILLDIGNCRVKWALSHAISQLLQGKRSSSQMDNPCHVIKFDADTMASEMHRQFRNLPRPDSVWMSCTGGPYRAEDARQVCQQLWGIQPKYVSTATRQCGIKNGYVDPQQLGVDRWLAMIGARHFISDQPFLLIDAGTAITIDFVDASGIFAGGIIIQGLMAMIEASCDIVGLPKVDYESIENSQCVLQNPDTQQAIVNGALHATLSSINHAIARCREDNGEQLKIAITGGDAPLLNRLSKEQMEEYPNLVLMGLLLVMRESDC